MGHYANKCPSPKKSVTSAAQQVRFKPTYLRKPAIRTAATRIKMPQVDQPKGLIDNSSNHMLINIKVDGHPARALIDQQTTGASLISTTFASTYNLPTVALTNEITVNLALQGSRGKSTHYVRSTLEIGGHMIDVYLCVVALADWDLILGEPILRMIQTIIDVTNQMITIQPKSTDRPVTLSAIPNNNKAPRRQLVLAALVTIAATNIIPQQDQQPNIIEISDDDSLFDDKPCDNEMTSLIKPYSYDDGVDRLGYDPIKEFEDVFPLKKPTALPPLRAINHKINIIEDAAYKALQPRRFKPTEAFLPQLKDKIDAEEKTGRVYAAQDSSACSIFIIKKYDKPNETRFLHHLRARKDITIKDKTPIPDITCIIDAVASHEFRSKIHLTDGYHNV